MRPHGSPAQLEARRRHALQLWDQGLSLNEVGRQIQCHASSVMRWRDAVSAGGTDGLNAKPASGRPTKLTRAQRARLVTYLLKGAMAHGYRTELWTTRRIADLIEDQFGVHYHPNHIGKLMHALGWTPQKPERRSLERDEAAIEEWKQRQWPRIKKTLRGWVPISCLPTNPGSN
jgi:transposase